MEASSLIECCVDSAGFLLNMGVTCAGMVGAEDETEVMVLEL